MALDWRTTRREPTQARGKHANSTQKCAAQVWTQDHLGVRQDIHYKWDEQGQVGEKVGTGEPEPGQSKPDRQTLLEWNPISFAHQWKFHAVALRVFEFSSKPTASNVNVQCFSYKWIVCFCLMYILPRHTFLEQMFGLLQNLPVFPLSSSSLHFLAHVCTAWNCWLDDVLCLPNTRARTFLSSST